MSTYTATIRWRRGADEAFVDQRYGRGHEWAFDGGAVVRGSSSPQAVPRFSDPAGIDPEEALVAALSSCHMLTFLYLAAKARFTVGRYDDAAEGVTGKTDTGREWVSRVTLRPLVVFEGGRRPGAAEVDALHHAAHEECYIANSVRTEIVIEGRCEGLAED